MSLLAELVSASKELGVFQFFLPYVFSFVITYGILSKINIFGKEKIGKNINLILSLIISLFIIVSTPFGPMFVSYIGSVFTGVTLVIVTILGSMMMLYVLGALIGVQIPEKNLGKKWTLALILITISLSVGVFVSSGGASFFPGITLPGFVVPEVPLPAIPSINLTMTDIAFLIMAVALVAVIWWLYKEEPIKSEK